MKGRRSPTAALRHHAQTLDAMDQENSWRQAKPVDLVAFNGGAEAHFITWTTQRIRHSRTKSIDVNWLISNAAYELDVSVLTIKRYLQKHTADRAPFKSNGKSLWLRKGSQTAPRKALQRPDIGK